MASKARRPPPARPAPRASETRRPWKAGCSQGYGVDGLNENPGGNQFLLPRGARYNHGCMSHPFRRPAAVIAVLLVGGWSARCLAADASPAAPSPQQVKFFESKVRPLLVAHCFECHADKKQKGGLRLDSADTLIKGGKNGPVLVPGHPEKSKLILAVTYKDADLQMPPEN